MKKQKKPFYEKFDPVELWMWQNKKYFGKLLKYSMMFAYGSRHSKYRYDFVTGEFVWNEFKQIENHKWSKEPIVRRIPAIKLLRGHSNADSPMWVSFQKALLDREEYYG
jgi:hypothetical protein